MYHIVNHFQDLYNQISLEIMHFFVGAGLLLPAILLNRVGPGSQKNLQLMMFYDGSCYDIFISGEGSSVK